MPKQHSFLVKTKGWLLSHGTLADIEARADYTTYTNNGRYAWAERNKIELTGLAIEDEVAFPMGWSVQETHPPKGYCIWIMLRIQGAEDQFDLTAFHGIVRSMISGLLLN